jgi:hypothetical protein
MDNFVSNAGSGGATFAADDVGSVLYPRVKVTIGDDGVNGGDVSLANPMPTSDATLADIVASISNMNETMLYMLSAMLEKMPRLSKTDMLVVDMSETGLSSTYGTQNINSVSNPFNGVTYYRMLEPWQFSDAGCARIYNQITVV